MVDEQERAGPRSGRVIQNIASLLRERWEQAQREGRAFARDLLTAVILILVAIVLVLLAGPLAVVAIILALAEVFPAWAAVALVLAAMLLVAAGLLLVAKLKLRGRRFKVVQDLRSDLATIRRIFSTSDRPPASTP